METSYEIRLLVGKRKWEVVEPENEDFIFMTEKHKEWKQRIKEGHPALRADLFIVKRDYFIAG